MDERSERPSALSAYRRAWPRLWEEIGRLLLMLVVFVVFQIPSAFRLGTLGGFLIALYQLFVIGPLSFGFSYVFLVAARGGRVEVSDLFLPFQRAFRACVVANVLLSALVMLACVPLVGAILYTAIGSSALLAAALCALTVLLPLFVAIRLVFVPYIVVDEAIGPLEALRQSWHRTAPVFADLVVLALIAMLLVAVGALALLVGAILAMFWSALALATLYSDLSDVDAREDAPPPAA